VLAPAVFREITKIFSEFNMAGYYIATAYTVLMVLDFTRESVISLLDDKRKTMRIACGFDDGELFDIGVLQEKGLVSVKEAYRQGPLKH
jgi:hypothetical protein